MIQKEREGGKEGRRKREREREREKKEKERKEGRKEEERKTFTQRPLRFNFIFWLQNGIPT
jgi:hypothetical protein